MNAEAVSSEAQRMAWKMVDTIFPRAGVSTDDSDRLLCCVTLIALSDLLDRTVVWARELPAETFRLFFEDHAVGVIFRKPRERLPRQLAGRWIRKNPTDRDVETALDESETICDHYQLDEEERDTLFTALPCLGLNALGTYLVWKGPAPFAELG